MSRAIWILAVLLSHWRRHPMQLATLLIGLISATALWSGVQALNQQARDSYDRAAATFGGARTAMLVARQGATFPQQLFVDLRRAGWPVSPVLEGRVQLGGRSFRLLGIEPVTLPAEVGNAPAIGREGLQAFVTPPGETLAAPEMFSELNLPEGATPPTSDGMGLPPLRVQPQLVPGVFVVDIGIAQQLLKMPDQVSRLLIGKSRARRAPLESIAGDKLRMIEPDAESDLERLTDSFHLNLTAFGLLSFFVGLFGCWTCVRAAPADAADVARLRGVRAHAEYGVANRTGIAGAGRGAGGTGLRLPNRGVFAARCRGELARTLWRADSGAADAQAGMVDCGHRHQRARRAGGGDR
jgi:putative ABC transport system permease protein